MDRARYERLEAVFERASELEGEERGAYLDEACEGDAEFRRQVERLLAHDDAEGEFPTPVLFDGEPAPSPERIGRYRITGRIAEGGMGTVYLAEQDHPHREVALKVIHPGLFSEEMLQRFRLEADLLGRLQHPGIAQIHEAGEEGTGGQPFFAMEYIRGVELRKYVEEKRLGIDARLELVARICDAVGHAHQKGIVHRDLKPGNILVVDETTGEQQPPRARFQRLGQPKVLDFGVSCLARDNTPGDGRLTLPGHVIGTPAYMSPEQAAGEPVDTRSDVYSLGVIAFELLSGRLPHELADTPLVHALRIVQDQPAPRLETVDRRLRGDLSILVGMALESDRERRYASATALADDIRRYLADQPIAARPPTLGYQLGRFVRRNRAFVAAACIALIGLMVGLVFALLSQREEARLRVVAETQREEARHAAYSARLQAATAYGANGDRHAAREQLAATDPELRGWEADYLAAILEDDVYRVPMSIPAYPISRSIPGVAKALFPVGPTTLRLFDFESADWTDHPCPLNPVDGTGAVVLLPDERHVLWGDGKGRLLKLDLSGESPPRELARFGMAIARIRVTAGGRRAVVVVCREQPPQALNLHLLDLDLERVIASWEEAPWIGTIACNANWIALGLTWRSGTDILLVDPDTLAPVRKLRGHEHPAAEAVFSPDGRFLASSGVEQVLRIWEVDTGRQVRVLGPFRYLAESLVFSEDGSRLFSGHADARIRRWNLETGECESATGGKLTLRPKDAVLRQLFLADDPDRIRAVGLDGVRVRYLGERLPSVLHHERTKYPYVSGVSFAPSGRILATCGWDGQVKIWNVATRELITTLDCPVNALWLEFSPDGGRLLVCSQLGYASPAFRLFDTGTWRSITESTHSKPAYCGLFTPAGDSFLVGYRSELRILDARTLELLESRPMNSPVWDLARSPDGKRIAYGLGSGHFVILDATSLQPILDVDAHERDLKALSFSPDGRHLVTGGADEKNRIWDVRTGKLMATFDAPESQELLCLRYSRDGRRIFSGSRREWIGVRDAASVRELLRLQGHTGYVKDLAWSPDGRILASASGDNTVRLWDSRPLRERLDEKARVLDAEAAVRERVEHLLEESGSLEEVLEAIETDGELGPLERHAARNVLHRSRG